MKANQHMMRHYFLTPPTPTSVDTIYVVDAADTESAAYLVSRLGCERITRKVAERVDRAHRHTGRGSAWAGCKKIGYDDNVILGSVDATQDTIDFYREQDRVTAENVATVPGEC
jgi:hypothetical protein